MVYTAERCSLYSIQDFLKSLLGKGISESDRGEGELVRLTKDVCYEERMWIKV